MNFSLKFEINPRKITHYLLLYLPENDKSQFLANYGYTVSNWQQLQTDLLRSAKPTAIIDLIPSGWGLRLKLKNQWQTPNSKQIRVITIWQLDKNNQIANFITLYPDKNRGNNSNENN